MKKIFVGSLILSSIINMPCAAQNGFTSNNSELEEIYDRSSIINPSKELFHDVRPFNLRDINELSKDIPSSYLIHELNEINKTDRKPFKKLFGAFYEFPESFLGVTTEKFYLRCNPILELKAGKENNNSNTIYTAFRGVEFKGNINGLLNFYGQLTENQMRPFQYISQYGTGFNGQNNYNFNPYYTYWKDIQSNTGYDFSNSIGYLEYNPSKHFSLMMGHDRNHYGYGYRSLFLGDNGAPYFQLKANAYFWKFHYQALFAEFTGQYERGADRLLPKKYGAFHLLTFKPSKKLDISLFEGIIFHRNNGFELNYLNPIIFYHSIEHSLGSSDNALIGIQAKYNILRNTQLYTQFLLDDLQVNQFLNSTGWWGNKYGVQFGAKFVNIFKINNLDGQIEYNMVRPYTFSHYSTNNADTIDNYTHYNQPLAHPYGANFSEIFARLSYRPLPKLKVELKYNYNIRGTDIAGVLFGNNIFSNTIPATIYADFNNRLLQGNKITNHFLYFSTQYSLFHNVFLDFDLVYRDSKSELLNSKQSVLGFTAGLRVNLRKRDYMF